MMVHFMQIASNVVQRFLIEMRYGNFTFDFRDPQTRKQGLRVLEVNVSKSMVKKCRKNGQMR